MGKDSEFLEAARSGNIITIEKYLNAKTRRSGPLASLRRGPGANIQDLSGYTALHHAALNGHKDVVNLLLRYEASVNVQDSKGSTPLHLASWAGHVSVVKTLIHQGPSMPHINHQNKGGETALHCAAQYGHLETACLLLGRGGDPTLPNLKAETPLDLAAQFGRLSLAELLLRESLHDLLQPYSEDASTTAVFPHTPLHLASRNGHLGVVKLLIQRGHNVNVRTSQGSPLHEAAICGKVDVVRTLMEAGSDPGVRNDLGHTVLDTISSIHTPVTMEISGLIKSLHARLIDFNSNGSSPLTNAEDRDNSKVDVSSSPSVSSSIASVFEFSLLHPVSVSSCNNDSVSSPATLQPSQTHTPISQTFSCPDNSFRSSSAPTTSLSMIRSSSPTSVASSSPPSLAFSFHSPSEFGCPYENVLIPTPMYELAEDGEGHGRTIEKRKYGKGGKGSGRGCSSRISDSRRSEKDSWSFHDKDIGGRMSDRESRLSDLDGRASVASHVSETLSEYSVYDVPPTPRTKPLPSASSDRGSSMSTRSSSNHEVLNDDVYDIPAPPRTCPSGSLRPPKDYLDSASIEGVTIRSQPPPKPPRRSICPPSPTSNSGDGNNVYEAICLATSDNSQNKDSGGKNLGKKASSFDHPYRSLDYANRGNFRTSSDSDSDSSRPHRPNAQHNMTYGSITFKPVKSRRTTKVHSYENTVHSYENHDVNSCKKSRRKGHGDSTSSGVSTDNLLASSDVSRHGSMTEHYSGCGDHHRQSVDDPWAPLSRRPQKLPQRAKSMQAKMAHTDASSDDFDDDSDDGKRPKSLDFGLCDDEPKSRLQKRNSRDIETETESEDLLQVELRSKGVGSPPHPTANPNEGYERVCDSPCSLSSTSAASLSDKSASTDNIEEVKSDVPFAGLYRGSKVPAEWLSTEQEMAFERPRSLASPNCALKSFDKGCRKSFPFMNAISPGNGNVNNNNNNKNNNNTVSSSADQIHLQDKKGVVLSPLEEAEEWARIQDIMASFGSGVARESVFMAELEEEFQQRLGMSLSPSQSKLGILTGGSTEKSAPIKQPPAESEPPAVVGAWLKELDLGQYEAIFLAQGFDDVKFLNGLLDLNDLQELGVSDKFHVDSILSAVESLPCVLPPHVPSCRPPDSLTQWLESINLPQYAETFRKHGFGDMERVRKIWEVELSVVLEVTQPGHRKRMLASLGDRPIEPQLPSSTAKRQDISIELSKLNEDISQLKQKLYQELPNSTSRERRPPEPATNTIRKGTTKRRAAPPPPPKAPRINANSSEQTKDKSGGNLIENLPLRDPSELSVGVSNLLISTWRHHPSKLVESNVRYVAQYLGSTHVKKLKGTESTMKSIHKLRLSTTEGAKVPLIVLAVSYTGVRFIDASTQSVVCEHEIRNIHCACQDADDLSHFAYITIDMDTNGHFCHVFRVQSKDLANEVVMTIGQAFEVAYQLACRKFESSETNQSDEQKLVTGHSRSLSEHVRCKGRLINGSSHTRSLSSTSHPYTGGSYAPHTSREDLLSDSGNNLDDESERSPSRRETSSPSSSPSTSESSCLHLKPLAKEAMPPS